MEVPTISLAGYFEAERSMADGSEVLPQSLLELVASIRHACEEVGFFVVVDHGVDPGLMEGQRRECEAFFDRPPQCTVLGLLPGGESTRFAWLDYLPPDVPEGGNAGIAGQTGTWSLGPVEGRGSLPWRPDCEAFLSTWAAYYAAMERLVAVLMRLFALALGLPASAFEPVLRRHRSSMRAILYPEVPEADLDARGGEVIRSGEHTDWGCLTVLLPDPAIGGLEVRAKDGTWSPVRPCAGGLVVNLGELLPWWTAGRWVATPHRVVARRDSTRKRRLSVPYFGLVDRGAVLSPLVPSLHMAAAKPVTAGEFFDRHEELSRQPWWKAPTGGS